MKNLQTRFLKFILALSFFSLLGSTNAQSQKIKEADSLFRAKQYTQSLERYQALFLNEKKYSPAMLLKMAYIQEGLGKIGPTLYYLTLYHNASDDEQALHKMDELAAKFKLAGYDTTDASQVKLWINKRMSVIQLTLACILLAASYFLYKSNKSRQKPWLAGIGILVVSAGMLYLNNNYTTGSVILNNNQTYLMKGPSAGAGVAGILGEGNQLQLLGHEDVWLRVKWVDKIVYVKNTTVLTVKL
ncbi:MAG TPA: hypothetical protein VKQ08_06190 [Cyclobacteriaceae bacterium]|nr:hypothetical protein [Cyclobacteriaceae bacterium]